MKSLSILAAVFFAASFIACSAESPKEQAKVTVQGKTILVEYSAPSVRGRKIFGAGGRLSEDPNYPIWRAGANSATAFHTDADLEIEGLHVPKGNYTLYVSLAEPEQWQLVISKQTGQWGLTYNKDQDLGRVKMQMSKPAAPVETLKYALTSESSNRVKLQLAWDNYAGSVLVTVR